MKQETHIFISHPKNNMKISHLKIKLSDK